MGELVLKGDESIMEGQILFTPSSLLDLLTKIEELKGLDVGVTESVNGDMYIKVGESSYKIDTSNVTDISVEDDVVETIEDVNEETYSNLGESDEVVLEDDPDKIESSIIKELAKTLLLGGMVRLSAKWLRGDKK